MSHLPPPQGPGYGWGYGAGAPVPRTNGKATASMVTGITSLVLSWCCGLGLVGIVAVVLGVQARAEIQASGGSQDGDGMALAGIVTGAVAALLGLLSLVVAFALLMAAGSYDPGAVGGTAF
jgi:hypothetical protein